MNNLARSPVPAEEGVVPSPEFVEPATTPVEEVASAIAKPEPKGDSTSVSVYADDVESGVSHEIDIPPRNEPPSILIHPHYRLTSARMNQFPWKVCRSCTWSG